MPFFPYLNLVSLFLVIGIGADDIFVFMDAWKQSFALLNRKTPLSNRLAWTIRRAGSAMFVTTLTTAASFAASIANPITAIKCFGLFSAMVIVADFCLMMILFPTVIILHYMYFSTEAGKIQTKVLNILHNQECEKYNNETENHSRVSPQTT